MQELIHAADALSPPALVSSAFLLMCLSTLFFARLVVVELNMRLDRLERVVTGLLAAIELLKPARETVLPPSPAANPKVHTGAVLPKALGHAVLEVDEPQRMHHQVAWLLD